MKIRLSGFSSFMLASHLHLDQRNGVLVIWGNPVLGKFSVLPEEGINKARHSSSIETVKSLKSVTVRSVRDVGK
ncbi:MAG: hypothetical protein O6948_03210 [Deltaproteobacteria bacterium]|nr:hypothetical protein [Deltaproteobacteria bacterium]